MKPRRAIHFSDGQVVTLDICGEKIPDMCGLWADVRERVLEAADEKTHFECVDADGNREDTVAESW